MAWHVDDILRLLRRSKPNFSAETRSIDILRRVLWSGHRHEFEICIANLVLGLASNGFDEKSP